MKYSKVSILGVGLIGGSIGRDLKSKKLAENVCGWGRNEKRLKKARKSACHTITTDIKEAVSDSEIIILCTPPEIIKKQLVEIKPYLEEDMLVMDVGSVKSSIVKQAEKIKIYKTGAAFIGCHPMAGSEKSGMENSKENLFVDAPCILTPLRSDEKEDINKGREFWKELGSNVILMDYHEHDLLVGFVSHITHLISSILVNSYSKRFKDTDLIKEIAGTSFIDMTRIAGSSPELWSQIYRDNRKNVLLGLNSFEDSLKEIRKYLKKKDNKAIVQFLKKSAEYKNKL